MPPVIDAEKCIACGVCADLCAEDVFFGSTEGGTPVVSHPEACFHCHLCAEQCPAGALWLRTPMPMLVPFK